MGLEDLIEQPEPLSVSQYEALRCWAFLGGWYPERLPLWLALYPCQDVSALVERLLAIRDAGIEASRKS